MTYNFGDDPDTLDGFDTEEPVEVPPQMQQEEPPIPGYVEEPVTTAQLEANEEEEYASIMAQVDRRMKVANYYRMILEHEFFPDNNVESNTAQNRIRKFVREELEVLLGMKAAKAAVVSIGPAASQFSDDEVAVLRELIARLKKPTPAAPQFKPMAAAPAPVAPAVNKVVQSLAAAAPKKPAPAVQVKPVAPPKPPVAQNGTVDPRIPMQYRKDPTARIENGKVLIQARNEDGQPLWAREGKGKPVAIMKDVTPVARPVGVQPLPMPSIAQSNSIESNRADENIRTIERLASRNSGMAKIAGGLLYSLQQPEE